MLFNEIDNFIEVYNNSVIELVQCFGTSFFGRIGHLASSVIKFRPKNSVPKHCIRSITYNYNIHIHVPGQGFLGRGFLARQQPKLKSKAENVFPIGDIPIVRHPIVPTLMCFVFSYYITMISTVLYITLPLPLYCQYMCLTFILTMYIYLWYHLAMFIPPPRPSLLLLACCYFAYYLTKHDCKLLSKHLENQNMSYSCS